MSKAGDPYSPGTFLTNAHKNDTDSKCVVFMCIHVCACIVRRYKYTGCIHVYFNVLCTSIFLAVVLKLLSPGLLALR